MTPRRSGLKLLVSALLCFTCASIATRARAAGAAPARYRILYNPAAYPAFRIVPVGPAEPSAPPTSQPRDFNQVSVAAFDSVNNALRINAALNPGGTHTPGDADQVFTSIFDSVNNAVRVNCVIGCGGSTTFGTDIAPIDSAHQKVIGFNSIPLASAAPTNNQAYLYNSALNQWAPSAINFSVLGGQATASQIPSLPESQITNLSSDLSAKEVTANKNAPNGYAGLNSTSQIATAAMPLFGASGASHAPGAVPDPGSTAGSTRFLREDQTWAVPPGGGGAPGGANTAVQFNNSAVFGGDATNFFYNTTTHALTLTGVATASSFTASGPGAGYTAWTSGTFNPGAAGTVTCGGNASNQFACSDNGAAATPLAMIAGDLGGTQGAEQVNALHLSAEGQLGSQPLSTTVPNDGTTGTTQALLAKVNASGNAITISTTDTGIPVYIVASPTGKTGNARLVTGGEGQCTFDSALSSSSLSHFVQASGTTAGDCHDAGATLPSSGWTLGQIVSFSGSSGGVQLLEGSAAGGGGAPGGTTTQLQFNNAGAFGGASNVLYNTASGQFSLNQLANSNEALYGSRATDTSPTGNLIHFQNHAATSDLFKVDVAGNLTTPATVAAASYIGAVENPAGTVLTVDGKNYTSAVAAIQTLSNNTNATIYDNVIDTFNQDPFNIPGHAGHFRIVLGRQSTAYTTNVQIHICPGCELVAQSTHGVLAAATVGAELIAGPTFPAALVDPAAAPTATATTTGCTTPMPAGNYLVGFTYLNATNDETKESPLTAAVAASGSNCISVTSPAAETGAAAYNVFITSGAAGTEAYQATTALGTATLLQGTPLALAGPPSVNSTAALVTLGNNTGANPNENGAIAFGARVERLYIDCNGVPNGIAVFNGAAQEQSGAFNIDTRNCGGAAAFVAEGYHASTDGAENSGFANLTVNDSDCSTSLPCTGGGGSITTPVNPTYGVLFDNVKTFRGLAGFSITPDSGTTVAGVEVTAGTPVGIQNAIGVGHVADGHCEGLKNTFLYCVEASGEPVWAENINSSTATTTAIVHLGAGSAPSTLIGIKPPASGPVAVKDDVRGFSSQGNAALGFYTNDPGWPLPTGNPFYLASAYGCAGDNGATDNTGCLTSVLSALGTAGGKVYFGPSASNIYAFKSGVTLSNSNIAIECAPGVVLQRFGATAGWTLAGSFDSIRNCTLDGNNQVGTGTGALVTFTGSDNLVDTVTIQNAGSTNPTTAALQVTNGSRNKIKNVTINSIADKCVAVIPPASTGVKDTLISGNTFTLAAGTATLQCIYLSDSPTGASVWGTQVLDNTVYFSGSNAMGYDQAFQLGNSLGEGSPSQHSVFKGNKCFATAPISECFHSFGTYHSAWVGNEADDQGNATSAQLFHFGDTYDTTISANTAKSGGGVGCFSLIDYGRDSVTGNTCDGVGNSQVGFKMITQSGEGSDSTFTGNVALINAGKTGTCYNFTNNSSTFASVDNAFTGNHCKGDGTSGQTGLSFTDTLGTLSNFTVADNLWASLTTGISIGAGSANIMVGRQGFDAVSTQVTDAGTASRIDTHVAYGTATLAAGAATVTLSGADVFSSGTSYLCQAADTTTPANAVTVTAYTSGTAFTLAGTGTDAVRYSCRGW